MRTRSANHPFLRRIAYRPSGTEIALLWAAGAGKVRTTLLRTSGHGSIVKFSPQNHTVYSFIVQPGFQNCAAEGVEAQCR